MKKTKWFICTVLVGLIPVFCRIFVWLADSTDTVSLFTTTDFIVFGLILHISNINQVEHIDKTHDVWKGIINGVSIIFIAFFGVLFAVYLLGEANTSTINIKRVNQSVLGLTIVSFILSFAVFHRLSSILQGESTR